MVNVATLWILRKDYEDGVPELLVAWDEWSIEENWEGWRDACDAALKAVGDDVAAKRFLNIAVKDDQLTEAFREWRTMEAEKVTDLDDPRSL